MEIPRQALRRAIVIATLAVAILTSGCAGAKKEAREPQSQEEDVKVRCPYCKAVLHW